MMDLSAKTSYLVTYDISDPKRLTAVYRTLKGFGDHLQLSVFRCELTARQFVDLRVALLSAINVDEDQVLVVDLGAVDGRGGDAISSLGRVYQRAKRMANVF